MLEKLKKLTFKTWALIWAGIGALATFFSFSVPIYQFIFEEEPKVLPHTTTVYQETLKPLEIREPTLEITVRDRNRYIFFVPGSLSVFRVIVANNTNKTLQNCTLKYQYNFPDFNGGRFLRPTKAIPAKNYNALEYSDRFYLQTGGYGLKQTVDFYEFSIDSDTEKHITGVLESFYTPPHLVQAFVSCKSKISNKVQIPEDDISFVKRSLDLPDWYYSLSKLVVAPYR